MGLACTDIACPHCRRQLPPGFLEMPQSILSLIGAPSSGKSYFLAAATHVLQEKLARDFGLAFKDGDPTGNMLLNQMRNSLFSATTPDQALLGKTALEGATYEKLPRLGRMVSLHDLLFIRLVNPPKPTRSARSSFTIMPVNISNLGLIFTSHRVHCMSLRLPDSSSFLIRLQTHALNRN
jgi:hypothetical protein